jgi:hypothetical protein
MKIAKSIYENHKAGLIQLVRQAEEQSFRQAEEMDSIEPGVKACYQLLVQEETRQISTQQIGENLNEHLDNYFPRDFPELQFLNDRFPFLRSLVCLSSLEKTRAKQSTKRSEDFNTHIRKLPSIFLKNKLSEKALGIAANLANPTYKYRKSFEFHIGGRWGSVPDNFANDSMLFNSEMRRTLYVASLFDPTESEQLQGKRLIEELVRFQFPDRSHADWAHCIAWFILGYPIDRGKRKGVPFTH